LGSQQEGKHVINNLSAELVRLAEEAVVLHNDMTGNQDAHENFIRNQIAIGLFKRHGTKVGMEVNRPDFVEYVVEKEKRADFRQLTAEQWRNLTGCERRSPNFKLDLIVWHVSDFYPEALVEVKKGQKGKEFKDDVKSISHLLTYCHRETLGYMVECLICRKDQILEKSKLLERCVEQLKCFCGQPFISNPKQISDTAVWYVTSVIPILRPPT
jgi:hypothetical protein